MFMLKNYKHIIFLISLICIVGCKTPSINQQIYNYKHPINFNPASYVCNFASEEIVIDGRADETTWSAATWSPKFVDIEGNSKPKPEHDTQVKMLWDNSYFYFYAKLSEPHIWAKLKNRDDIIYHDDDFEIFIDPDGDSHNYYELEWNAFNTLWDLILLRPYRVDNKPKVLFEWNVHNIKSAVHIEGTINDPSDIDEFWSIEIALPWSALKELAPIDKIPKPGDQWRVNFSRVDWTMEVADGDYIKVKDKKGKTLPENNWVWSPTGRINMHMPEMWGFVQFSKDAPSKKVDKFEQKDDEQIKWGLWNLYWQQLDYFKANKHYSPELNLFTIPDVKQCKFSPTINTTPNQFEIVNQSCDGKGFWIIDQTGKIYLKENEIKPQL